MMTILNYDQWLADAHSPELVDAFNGPSDMSIDDDADDFDDKAFLFAKVEAYADEYDCSFDAAWCAVTGDY